MGDITRTKANVRPLAGAKVRRGTVGATCEAGQPVYLDGTNGWKPADANAGSGAEAARGILVSPQDPVSGDEVDIVYSGPVTGYSGMTPDGVVYVSNNVGEPSDTAGSNSKIIGWSETALIIIVNCSPDGDP